jgi:hypothetical protein
MRVDRPCVTNKSMVISPNPLVCGAMLTLLCFPAGSLAAVSLTAASTATPGCGRDSSPGPVINEGGSSISLPGPGVCTPTDVQSSTLIQCETPGSATSAWNYTTYNDTTACDTPVPHSWASGAPCQCAQILPPAYRGTRISIDCSNGGFATCTLPVTTATSGKDNSSGSVEFPQIFCAGLALVLLALLR